MPWAGAERLSAHNYAGCDKVSQDKSRPLPHAGNAALPGRQHPPPTSGGMDRPSIPPLVVLSLPPHSLPDAGGFQDVQRFVHLGVGDHQGGEHPDDVAVNAALDHDHASPDAPL